MTLGEALLEAGALARSRVAGGTEAPRRASWEGLESPSGKWSALYWEDWERRFMKPSLNGKLQPVLLLSTEAGTEIFFERLSGEWRLVPARLGADGDEALAWARLAFRKWKEETE